MGLGEQAECGPWGAGAGWAVALVVCEALSLQKAGQRCRAQWAAPVAVRVGGLGSCEGRAGHRGIWGGWRGMW